MNNKILLLLLPLAATRCILSTDGIDNGTDTTTSGTTTGTGTTTTTSGTTTGTGGSGTTTSSTTTGTGGNGTTTSSTTTGTGGSGTTTSSTTTGAGGSGPCVEVTYNSTALDLSKVTVDGGPGANMAALLTDAAGNMVGMFMLGTNHPWDMNVQTGTLFPLIGAVGSNNNFFVDTSSSNGPVSLEYFSPSPTGYTTLDGKFGVDRLTQAYAKGASDALACTLNLPQQPQDCNNWVIADMFSPLGLFAPPYKDNFQEQRVVLGLARKCVGVPIPAFPPPAPPAAAP